MPKDGGYDSGDDGRGSGEDSAVGGAAGGVDGGGAAGGYFADSARIRAGIEEMQGINDRVQQMRQRFESAVAATRGWPGEGDSFAKEIRPGTEKEDSATHDTTKAIADAVQAATDGTASNVQEIGATQAGAQDEIQRAKRAGRA